ncbi:MAG: hypothetical protein ACLR6J_12685 [Parabacteroides merdae]
MVDVKPDGYRKHRCLKDASSGFAVYGAKAAPNNGVVAIAD